ncbi:MAG: beta-phosphoglucomutase [Bacteroidota bacterium]
MKDLKSEAGRELPLACIFDLDGVIVDTATYHYEAWKRLANSLGFDFTHEQNEQLKGISRMDSLDLVLGWGNTQKSPVEKIQLAQQKNAWYLELIGQMKADEILPGVRQFIEELKAAGVRIALGSASKNSAEILERTGISDFFDVIVDGNSVSRSKPDPEVFSRGAELLGLAPESCVVIEDAAAGVEAAHRAGMKVIGIGDPQVLKNADLVIPGTQKLNIDDLKNLGR